MASLIALDQELEAVKSELDKKVFECKRAQIVEKFSVPQNDLDLKKAVKDAEAAFEVVRKETKMIKALKRRLDEAKTALRQDVAGSNQTLADAVARVKSEALEADSKETEFNIRMLQKKVEGSELHLEMGLKKIRKFEVFEKDLENATGDLLSILAMHQEKCIEHIVNSPAPEEPLQEKSLPSKHSSEMHIWTEAMRQVMQERDRLKADLESLVTSADVGSQTFHMVHKLENEVFQLKSELAAMERGEANNEFSIMVKSNSKDSGDLDEETSMMQDEDEDEDSYGFEDMAAPIGTMQVLSTRADRDLDDICTAELHALNDIKLVQPDYEELIADQMKHEEELEEYAVEVLTLKETIVELQDENRELRYQLEVPEESNEEIEQLEAEVCMWKAKYDEAADSADQVENLQRQLERTRVKGNKQIRALQDDLETLQTEGSARVKSLMEKFKTFQAQGSSRVESLQFQLEESQIEVATLLKDRRDIATSSSATDGRLEGRLYQSKGDVPRGESPPPPERVGEEEEDLQESDSEEEHEEEKNNYDESDDQGKVEEKMIVEDAADLRAELDALKSTMNDDSARMGNEMEQLRRTIESLQSEKVMKQEVISSLQEQLNSAERALLQKHKSMNFPVVYSYGSFDSETEAITDDSSY